VIRSVLVIKLGAIGDVVMAAPMATALKRAHPGASVTWLCGHTVAPLLQLLPDIDEIVELDEKSLLTGKTAQRARVMASAVATLRRRRFDLVLNGHPDPRYRVLETLVRGGTVRRFVRSPRKRPLPIPGRYHGDEYIRLATGVDGPDMDQVLPAPIRPPLPERLSPTGERRGSRFGLAPGGARNVRADDAVRRWPLQRYVELAERLVAAGHEIVLVGSRGDLWVREAFAGVDRCTDRVGETSLPELLAVLGTCDAVVTHDSGPMHLARIAGTPLVAMFGPTLPQEKVPAGAAGRILSGGEDLPCRPCYDGRRFADCPAVPCMASIGVGDVVEAALGVAGDGEGPPA